MFSLPDLRQSQSPETVPICIVAQCFPHDNIAEIHICDDATRRDEALSVGQPEKRTYKSSHQNTNRNRQTTRQNQSPADREVSSR